MVPISINKFIKDYMKNNNGESEQIVKKNLQEAVKRKKEGAVCSICGQPIWAIGSSIAFEGCFSCITGEADDSEDYEIDEVCYFR